VDLGDLAGHRQAGADPGESTLGLQQAEQPESVVGQLGIISSSR
jgi:hypothetical protein